MPHGEERFETNDGLQLHENRWLPETTPVGVVVLVHGFTEHSGRYAQLATELNNHGYAVYAIDLRGHGKSEGPRVFIRSFEQHLDDVEQYVQQVRRIEPNKPVFLLGHSMGGTIIVSLAATRRPDADGLVVSGAALMIGDDVFPILRRLASVVGRVFPKLAVVKMGSKMLSRDPAVVAHFDNDPLVFHNRFPVRTGAEILRAARQVRANLPSVRLPILILQGTADTVIDPEGSRELYTQSGSADKTLKLYEGLYHDLFHEPERDQVTADLIAWLDGRCRADAPA